MAGANPTLIAKQLYDWAVGDDSRIAQLQAEYDSATVAAYLKKGGTDLVTKAIKNNVTVEKRIDLTESDRIAALNIALTGLKNGVRPSSKVRKWMI